MSSVPNIPRPGQPPPQGSGAAPGPSNDALLMMRYDANKKSALIAYLFWFFLGYLGAHRFYLGRIGTGLMMLTLFAASVVFTVILIGLFGFVLLGFWWLVDAFLIPGQVQSENNKLIASL
ncbi:TM2 domain-containing protein [Roseomonas hellenica]|uniref:TM2 domain-containing protein n=1 Tax=Plastoroseomonas hellenica TaxID=2687306 RepID=A0ABS5ESP0_9PROT|nr:TM2 domain-containing protein [Plastoroseomonas hellenica]MBR0663312.1 TM2 domain-containing protein [Plastoroseomonas hellenica]